MKLEYKILWLDDKIEEFIEDEYVEEIKKHLLVNGFIPSITTVNNSTEFFDKLNDSYDLILTDFHMNDMNGDQVVEEIRGAKYSVMTEILFYTAKANLTDTQKISRVSFLETNSSTDSHSESVVARTKELIDLTIKKFQHIVAMRGMIMHETSSLDEQTFQMVSDYIDKNDDDVRGSLYDELISFFGTKLKFSNYCQKNNRIDKVINDPLLLSSSQRANVLGAIIKKRGYGNFIPDFKTEIIQVRNQFAHAVLEVDENGREYFTNKRENQEFNSEFCKEIRTNILKHKNNLDELEAKLKE